LRIGEQMVHHRLHMSCDRYQQMSPNNNLLATCASFAPLEYPRLSWTFVTFADPEHWLPLMRYINFERADEAAFVVGGRCYTVFAHDWRVETFDMWWDQLCERSLSTEPVGADAAPTASSPVVVLSEQEFASSVREALRNFARQTALATNPLVRSRLVSDVDGNAGDPSRLQELLREALETLTGSPRDEKFRRALLYTYFQPALTQEGAAERLGLPFSTYRYHLARGTERIVQWLWERELSGSR
jgi:hypothetical protein